MCALFFMHCTVFYALYFVLVLYCTVLWPSTVLLYSTLTGTVLLYCTLYSTGQHYTTTVVCIVLYIAIFKVYPLHQIMPKSTSILLTHLPLESRRETTSRSRNQRRRATGFGIERIFDLLRYVVEARERQRRIDRSEIEIVGQRSDRRRFERRLGETVGGSSERRGTKREDGKSENDSCCLEIRRLLFRL